MAWSRQKRRRFDANAPTLADTEETRRERCWRLMERSSQTEIEDAVILIGGGADFYADGRRRGRATDSVEHESEEEGVGEA